MLKFKLFDIFGKPVGRNSPLTQEPAGMMVKGMGGAVDATPIPSTDVGHYRWVCVQPTGTFSATYAFEGSNDGTTWVGVALWNATSAGASIASLPAVSDNATNRLYCGPISFRYFRCRVSAYTSGTVELSAWFSSAPNAFPVASTGAALTSPGAAANDSTAGLLVIPFPHLYNGATWARQTGNNEATVLASAARTTSTNSSDLTNNNARGVIVTIDVTAITSSPSVVFTISYKCTLSGKYVALLASAAIVGTGTTSLKVYPGATVAANLAASMALPRVWRVEAAHGNADSITYSVSANYIL